MNDEPQQKRSFRRLISAKNLLVLVGILLVIVVGIILYLDQRSFIKNLQIHTAELSSNKDKLEAKNADLTTKNTNLAKAVKLLQSQATSDSKGTTSLISNSDSSADANDVDSYMSVSTAKPTAKIAINSLVLQPINISGTLPDGSPRPVIKKLLVKATITNLSSTRQNYNLDKFDATNENGVIVRPIGFGPGMLDPVWYWSEIAPGGHEDILLYFEPDTTLVALNWKLPDGTTLISSLPTLQ